MGLQKILNICYNGFMATLKNVKVVKYKNLAWYKILNPTEKELDWLQQKFNFHFLDIEDCQEKIPRAKIDIYKEYIFMVLHLPLWRGRTREMGVIQINIFLSEDFLVTILDHRLSSLDKLFYKAQKSSKIRQKFFGQSCFYLFYFIFNQLLLGVSPILRQLSYIINEIDKKIMAGKYKEIFEQISLMRRSLILFQTIIKPEIPIFAKLEAGEVKIAQGKYTVYWGNILDRLQWIRDEIDDDQEMLEGLATTNESLVSYKTNEIIKILTIFSVILMPLTLLSGIYGMNIRLPIGHHYFAFWIIAGIMLLISLIMLIFFKIKNWL